MTLLELCEPLFQFMARVNRSVRKNVPADAASVRADIKQIFADMRAKADRERLRDQFEKVELPLMYFVDSMIIESGGTLGKNWNALQLERGRMVGDDQFWDLLEETLADGGESATERLGVFYTCVGLGFTGAYNGKNDQLRRYMQKMQTRLLRRIDADKDAKIVPEAYEHVNTANLIEPPGRSLVGVTIALIGTVVVLLFANVFFFRQARADLARAVGEVREQLGGVKTEAASGESKPAETKPAEESKPAESKPEDAKSEGGK